MEYLVEYETLAKFVDGLIAEKYPNRPAEETKDLREDSIRQLDDAIYEEIFGELTDQQVEDLTKLLNDPSTPAERFQDFFKSVGINLEQRAASAMRSFANKFLGGENDRP